MAEKLVCDRCGAEYSDKPSIQMAKTMAVSWRAQCKQDSVEARGIAPCPIISCKGELILKGV